MRTKYSRIIWKVYKLLICHKQNPLILVAAESLTLPAEGLKARIEVKNVECMHFTIIFIIDKTALILIQI